MTARLKEQFERVKGYLELGKQEGAKPSLDGAVGKGKGFFVDPTIFTGVNNDMRIAREEIRRYSTIRCASRWACAG